MIRGTAVFDGLVVATLDADFTKATIVLRARAGFVNTKTGQTHGWTDGDGGIWSQRSMQKLAELRASLEEDLAARHLSQSGFEEESKPKTASSGEPGGLTEHLGSKDPTPSV